MGNFGRAWKGEVDNGKFFKEGTGPVSIPGKQYAKIAKGNRRVMNATEVSNDAGEVFDSRLEMFMDGLLRRSGLVYERQRVIVLQEKFRDPFTGNAVREIRWVADFWLPELGVIVDTKGWGTEIFKIKYKMFQRMVYDGRLEVRGVKFPSSQAKCVLVMAELRAMSRA